MVWHVYIISSAKGQVMFKHGLEENWSSSFLHQGRFSVGQNLASASYDLAWAGVIKLWYDEVKDFTLGGNNDLKKVGHYTQV